MGHYGEIMGMLAAVSCTATALFADSASHRLGAQTLNLLRMVLSIIMLGVMLWIAIGSPYPVYADSQTWLWLLLSGLVGYVFGDYCLFNSYVIFGSRYGQLFMTLAPPVSGIAGWLLLGERLSWHSWMAMLVTLIGIGISILAKGGGDTGRKVNLKLPLKGVLFGIGAGVGQGAGLVLSKIGLGHYEAALPLDAPASMSALLPFAGTFIRALAGFSGFLVIILLQRRMSSVRTALMDGKGMTLAALTTLFGPFIGVSLSLAAVHNAEVGIASTLIELVPVLIIAPYAIIHHQKVSLREVVGTLITIVGVAMFFLL